jgi:hypothetical protein
MITFSNTETRGNMSGESGVSLLISVVLSNVVKIISSNNKSVLHLSSTNNTLKDTASNRNIRGKRALLINITAFNSILRGLVAKTDALVPSNKVVLLSALGTKETGLGNTNLLLERLFGLLGERE